MNGDDDLVVHLDAPLPERLEIGGGQVLYLTGRCYHPELDLRALAILVDGVPHAVPSHSSVRADVPSDDPGIEDRVANSLTSGFWAVVPLRRDAIGRTVTLAFRAQLADGTTRIATIGRIAVVAGEQVRSEDGARAARPRIAICLATDNPEPASFKELVDAIVAQTVTDWTCIVADDGSTPDRVAAVRAIAARDARFRVVAHESRIGPYENLARAFAAVPADAGFVALADGNEAWSPAILAGLLAASGPDVTLACAGTDESYGTPRPEEWSDLEAVLFGDSLRASAALFPAALLVEALPFPPCVGDAHPDQWVKSVALARGRLVRVVERSSAVRRRLPSPTVHHGSVSFRDVIAWLVEAGRVVSSARLRERVMDELWRRREAALPDVARLVVLAEVLLLRLGTATTPSKRRLLERVRDLERAPWGLVSDAARAWKFRRGTLRFAWRSACGVLAGRLLDGHYRTHRHRLFEQRRARRDITGVAPEISALVGVDLIAQKLAPLRLRVEPGEPPRINVLTPAIDFAHLFGGYLGKLHLALRLVEAGQRVRLVIVDPCRFDLDAWRRGIAAYPGLEHLFDRVDVAYASDRSIALPVHPDDRFVATTWWTAYLANAAARTLGGARFLYLIQEYEPFTFPMGSLQALAAESYQFPHVALFSTEFLRDYFWARRLGVFSESSEAPALVFRNAIAGFAITADRLRRPGPRRLLFYARPEQHAARNMFEVGVMALRAAVAEGAFTDEWLLEGIGAGRAFAPVALGAGRSLRLRPRVGLEEYHELLPGYDVGLALMMTPHPSLVPLEMAAAGLVTVTNTYANKTADALRALSTNLLPVPPTLRGVTDGVCEAVRRSGDVVARAAGAEVAWSRDWHSSFDDALMRHILEGIGRG